MAVHGEVVLRLRVCLASDCRATFFLCSHCDRGQRYCSLALPRSKPGSASGAAPTAATSRVRKDGSIIATGSGNTASAGRNARVTDQGSLSIASPASSECGTGGSDPGIEVPPRSGAAGLPRWPEKRPGVCLCCRICGRAGRFIDPFPTHSTTKVRSADDQSRNPCANSPLLLRRTLEDRHHRQ